MVPVDNSAVFQRLLASGAIAARRSPAFESQPMFGVRRWDRVEGMMLGLAIGDALGNTSESMVPAERRARHGEIRDYLPNRNAENRRVGLPSDDTQLAFWTLDQLAIDGGLVNEHLARRFCGERIFGIGATVLTAVQRMSRDGIPWDRAGLPSAGNGALMRIAPVLVPHLARPTPRLWADVALASMITHNDPASIASCVAFCTLLWEVLADGGPPEPEWWMWRFLEVARQLETGVLYTARGGRDQGRSGLFTDLVGEWLSDAWRERLTALEGCERWHSGAYLLETIPCALYILMLHAGDPEEAIVRAVNDTRDNDSIAAIVGAAVGGLNGAKALPARWRDGLSGRTGATDDKKVFQILARARARFSPDAPFGGA